MTVGLKHTILRLSNCRTKPSWEEKKKCRGLLGADCVLEQRDCVATPEGG